MAVMSRPLPRVGAALLAIALMTAALAELPADPVRHPPEAVQLLRQALAEVESGEARTAAEAVADEDGLVAGGRPCLMRHKRMALGVDRSFRHRFASATFATDPEIKAALLDALAEEAPKGMARWRAHLAGAELAIRRGQPQDAAVLLDLAAKEEAPAFCRADEEYLRAATLTAPVQAAEALDRAVAADPGFWDAQEQLALVAARGTGAGTVACDADASRTIRATLQLGSLAQADVQFQRLERAVVGLPRNGRRALLHGMILHETSRADAAAEVWLRGLELLGTSSCDAVLRTALEGMLAIGNGTAENAL